MNKARLLADIAVVVVALLVILTVGVYLADALTGETVTLPGVVVEKEFARADFSASAWFYTVELEEGYQVVEVLPEDYTGLNIGDQVELRCIRGGLTGSLKSCKFQ